MTVTVITYWCWRNLCVGEGRGDMLVTVITYWCWRGKGRYDCDCDNVLVLAREGAI